MPKAVHNAGTATMSSQITPFKVIRSLMLVLLFLNGVAALIGGILLMTDTSGASLGLQPAFLAKSPFRDYFFPGLILFVGSGAGSLVAAVALVFSLRFWRALVVIEGLNLTIWILVQMAMLTVIDTMQFIMLGVGVLLLAGGLLLSYVFAEGQT
ncbi:MAG: hypothetical protein J0L53_04475 [Spirochaetes bacterium]|nr:hypothetical protein [Spirochaetota bacterium]